MFLHILISFSISGWVLPDLCSTWIYINNRDVMLHTTNKIPVFLQSRNEIISTIEITRCRGLRPDSLVTVVPVVWPPELSTATVTILLLTDSETHSVDWLSARRKWVEETGVSFLMITVERRSLVSECSGSVDTGHHMSWPGPVSSVVQTRSSQLVFSDQ